MGGLGVGVGVGGCEGEGGGGCADVMSTWEETVIRELESCLPKSKKDTCS